MVIKNNLEKSVNNLEARIKELEQSNEGLRSQFKYLEERVGASEEETKVKQEIINDLEVKD
ncbi:9796_t:CDS:2 [Funneliformis geosporum]|uniref:9796_t:CDS:1 n=1 Tax=Funneliformis geosporum TaxID=1117311 RepID=A0A9W4T0M0_9GLOM|nr:9796_t:CDS:2 [Funneliformis geosporum]